ncbi:MAG: Crp/Fnr family transcriptional regulator [Verrucomicrobiae bacterium]|nr:Crp/Fnr family transcriptional regulator [Verrucomicrobiae bacterium]
MSVQELKRFDFFSPLADADLERLSELILRRQHKAGTYITQEGQPNDKLHLVLSGMVEVVKTKASNEVVLGQIGPKGFYGEMSMFFPPTTTAGVKAREDSEVLSFPHEALKQFIREHPAVGTQIMWAMMEVICQRLDMVNRMYGDTMFWLNENYTV